MKVIEETLSIGTGHLTEVEAGIEIIVEDLVGIKETVGLGIEVDLPQGKKVKRECVITVESQNSL